METKDIIHFVGHAEFVPADPLASCLYLADDETVTARELFGATVSPMDLITLSGCETGVNYIHAGDEPLGLTRALLYAGASSLLLSLWRVDDASSTALMKAFYTHWIHGGKPKVDALRRAQQDLFETGQTAPYYWAPFVLIGDWY
jgi:CHAT domain-containing protein